MTGKKVFIAGPMSGYPDENFPAFDEWAGKLENTGCVVSNPAPVSRQYKTGKISYAQMLDRHLAMIKSCDTMFMLDGWEKSEGAKAELAKALALDMEIILQSNYKAPAEPAEPVETAAPAEPAERDPYRHATDKMLEFAHAIEDAGLSYEGRNADPDCPDRVESMKDFMKKFGSVPSDDFRFVQTYISAHVATARRIWSANRKSYDEAVHRREVQEEIERWKVRYEDLKNEWKAERERMSRAHWWHYYNGYEEDDDPERML